MNTPYRIQLLCRLGEYMTNEAPEWAEIKLQAGLANSWFTPGFTTLSVQNIAASYLQQATLVRFTEKYRLPAKNHSPKRVGLVMAGNIPLVGFHDFLCVFLNGHPMTIKPSSRDRLLIEHLAGKLCEWEPRLNGEIIFAEMLKGCDAYIATGSNNSARYFDYYFKKYPHIIRRNRTSVAILTGDETPEELAGLSDDVHLYFGLGCRNVTQVYVPRGYDFIPLLEAFKRYNYFFDHPKYKNNYDYQLALHLLNNKYYMSSGSLLLSENDSLFSPVSQLNYRFYDNTAPAVDEIGNMQDLQCLVSKPGLLTAFHSVPFGQAQTPSLTDYADGVDTMEFLRTL